MMAHLTVYMHLQESPRRHHNSCLQLLNSRWGRGGARTPNEAKEDLVFFSTTLSTTLLAFVVNISLILRSEKGMKSSRLYEWGIYAQLLDRWVSSFRSNQL